MPLCVPVRLGRPERRLKRVNDRSELAYSVESVFVFGSYLTDRTKLNDLDIGVELTRRGKEKATDEKL